MSAPRPAASAWRPCAGHGVQLAEGGTARLGRRVPVPLVEHPAGRYDLIAVFVRTHQVDAVLESLAGVEGDVLFLLNWAGGPEPLGAVIGPERMVLGFPTEAGTMDGDVVRYRPRSFITRRVPMPISEADGRITPRLERSCGHSAPPGSTPRPSRRWMRGSRRTGISFTLFPFRPTGRTTDSESVNCGSNP